MDMNVFWSTFWGGLASILAAGLITWLLAILWSRISQGKKKKPLWTMSTDQFGQTVVRYHGRKPAYDAHLDLWRREGHLSHDFRTVPVSIGPDVVSGGAYVVMDSEGWTDATVRWRDSPERYASAIRPESRENVSFEEYQQKTKLRHRLGNFLLSK